MVEVGPLAAFSLGMDYIDVDIDTWLRIASQCQLSIAGTQRYINDRISKLAIPWTLKLDPPKKVKSIKGAMEYAKKAATFIKDTVKTVATTAEKLVRTNTKVQNLHKKFQVLSKLEQLRLMTRGMVFVSLPKVTTPAQRHSNLSHDQSTSTSHRRQLLSESGDTDFRRFRFPTRGKDHPDTLSKDCSACYTKFKPMPNILETMHQTLAEAKVMNTPMPSQVELAEACNTKDWGPKGSKTFGGQNYAFWEVCVVDLGTGFGSPDCLECLYQKCVKQHSTQMCWKCSLYREGDSLGFSCSQYDSKKSTVCKALITDERKQPWTGIVVSRPDCIPNIVRNSTNPFHEGCPGKNQVSPKFAKTKVTTFPMFKETHCIRDETSLEKCVTAKASACSHREVETGNCRLTNDQFSLIKAF